MSTDKDVPLRKLLTVKQAATAAGVSVKMVYRWTSDGTLAHFRPSSKTSGRGRIRIDPNDLRCLLQKFRHDETTAQPAVVLPRKVHRHIRVT